MSSYVFVASQVPECDPSANLQTTTPGVGFEVAAKTARNVIVQDILCALIAVFTDQLLHRKDFLGLGLFMKVPPAMQDQQSSFETFILQNTLLSLRGTIKSNQKLLWEPRVLTNLSRFGKHISEAIYEGWFIGVETFVDFLGDILEYIQLPEVASVKSVRLCSQPIAVMRSLLLRIILLKLSDLDESAQAEAVVSFLHKLVYWQSVVLVAQDGQGYYLRLLCYLLYYKLNSASEEVRMAAANLWRMIFIQRQHFGVDLLYEIFGEQRNQGIFQGFAKIVELDNELFIEWIDQHRDELDKIFLGSLGKLWTAFVADENKQNRENSEARVRKRKERLKTWHAEYAVNSEALRHHELNTDHWQSNIYTSEEMRRQRALQDQQDNTSYNQLTWDRMKRELRRPCGFLEDATELRWQLDQTEGRNRMRKRLIPDMDAHAHLVKPKRKQSMGPSKAQESALSIRQRAPSMNNENKTGVHLQIPSGISAARNAENRGAITPPEPLDGLTGQDDGYEIVDGPQGAYEDYEDKNRKVMRSLERGDQVEHVLNVSRIIGLEACEGLLILGKHHLYLLDNLFQRSDGEIVNVWQAPEQERDP